MRGWAPSALIPLGLGATIILPAVCGATPQRAPTDEFSKDGLANLHITDCRTAVASTAPKSIEDKVVAALSDPRVQRKSKEAIASIEVSDAIALEVHDPASRLQRVMHEFRSDLHRRLVFEDAGQPHIAASWVENMLPHQILSCFPDLLPAMRTMTRRWDAADREKEQRRLDSVKREEEQFGISQDELRRTVDRPETAKSSAYVLGAAYVLYISVRRCHEVREGYQVVYISDPEMDRARHAIRRIEDEAKPHLERGVSTDKIWSVAANVAQSMAVNDRGICQWRFHRLEEAYRALVPDDHQIKKDF